MVKHTFRNSEVQEKHSGRLLHILTYRDSDYPDIHYSRTFVDLVLKRIILLPPQNGRDLNCHVISY